MRRKCAQYDAGNAQVQWNGSALQYDANGNLTGDGVNTYAWNSRNPLARIVGGASASFRYDALGRRLARTVNGAATQYLYDGSTPIQEQDGTGTPKANLLTGPGIDQYLARHQNGQSYSYLTDSLGSTIRLTDASQAVVARYAYDPYGQTATDNPTLATPTSTPDGKTTAPACITTAPGTIIPSSSASSRKTP